MARDVVLRPSGTSWGAVLDGWLAAVGVAAILTPLVGVLLAAGYTSGGYSATVPVLVAIGASYLIGGYVGGRMAGYRTSWHGMMVAFFGLFVVLALLVIDIALEQGIFGSTGRLVQIMPAVLGTTLFPSVETFAFGGALGMLIAIFAGWLGGLLAASRITTTVTGTPVPVRTTPVVEQQTVISTEVHPARGRFRLLSSAGRKGGEPVEEAKVPENKTGRADRTEPR